MIFWRKDYAGMAGVSSWQGRHKARARCPGWRAVVSVGFLLLSGGLRFLFSVSGLRFGSRVGARPTLFLLAQIDIVLEFHVLAAAPLRWIPDQVRNDGLRR